MTPRIIQAWRGSRGAPENAPRGAGLRLAGLVGALVAALLLSACGSVNAGTAGVAAMEQAFADDPVIESMNLGGANDLPWVGVVSGDVKAKAGISEADLRSLVDRLARFSAAYDGATVSVSVVSDGVQFPVDKAERVREAYLAFGLRLRDDPQVNSVEFESGGLLSVTADTPTAMFVLAAELPQLLAALPPESVSEYALRSSDGAVTLEGEPGPWIERAQQLWDGAAQYGATGLVAAPQSVELRVQREQDVADARNFAQQALAGSQVQLTVSSDVLGVAEGSSGDTARTLLAALSDEAMSRVLTSWTNDEVLQVAVAAPEDAQLLADELSSLQQARGFTTLAIFVQPDGAVAGAPAQTSGDAALSVYAAPAELATQIANARRLLGEPDVQTVIIASGRIEVSVSESVGETNLGAYAPVLKAAASSGQWVCVSTVSGAAMCTTAKPTIGPDDLGSVEHPSAQDFMRQWNAAPAKR